MGFKNKKILYFVPELCVTQSGILHSQVLAQMNFLNKNGAECYFVGSEQNNPQSLRRAKEVLNHYKIKGDIFPVFPNKLNGLTLLMMACKVARIYSKQTRKQKFDYIYVRSINGFLGTKFLKHLVSVKKIYDMRGVVGKESAIKAGYNSYSSKILTQLEKYSLLQADRISCVSSPLSNYINNLTNRSDSFVIPSCVDRKHFSFSIKARATIRDLFKINETDTLIVYSGGTSIWQRFPDIVKIMSRLITKSKNIHGFILTPDINTANNALKQYSQMSTRLHVKSVLREDVADYLSAADVGLLLRDRCIVNQVASPVKAAEYLACGIPVILSPEIGDISSYIEKCGVGNLIDGTIDDMCEKILSALPLLKGDIMKIKCQNACDNFFVWDGYICEFSKLYQ